MKTEYMAIYLYKKRTNIFLDKKATVVSDTILAKKSRSQYYIIFLEGQIDFF